jgi:hypothetical protein
LLSNCQTQYPNGTVIAKATTNSNVVYAFPDLKPGEKMWSPNDVQHQAEAWQDRDINNGSISSDGYPLTDVPIWLKGGDDSLVLSETTPRLSVSCGTYTFHWEN